MTTKVTYRIYKIYDDIPFWDGSGESEDENYMKQEMNRHIETYPSIQVQLAKVTETVEFI
jgi:hypothetical protein